MRGHHTPSRIFKGPVCDIIDLDWQVDLDHAREKLGDEIYKGNINPVLYRIDRRKVFDLSRNLVDRYKEQKYLLAAGCEITVLTPHQNLMAMRRASILT
jgi:uroporphyrinogen-III decarboxylase